MWRYLHRQHTRLGGQLNGYLNCLKSVNTENNLGLNMTILLTKLVVVSGADGGARDGIINVAVNICLLEHDGRTEK